MKDETIHYHTPGPWEFDTGFIVAPDPTGRHPDIYIAEIAIEDEEGRLAPVEQLGPNGFLIAAAPEMLEALELCEEVLSWVARTDDGTPSISALNMARNAIGKAKAGVA